MAAMPLLPEQTIRYKTYVKQSLVEALRSVFANHPDNLLQSTKVSIDYPTSENKYPTVLVRFYERQIRNAGVGHVEYLLRGNTSVRDKFRHYLYDGDIEFAIYALSSKDRDLISDSVVQTITMADTAAYTNTFMDHIYRPAPDTTSPYDPANYNYVNLNSDLVTGAGESQTQQPWLSEDQLQYQTSYRVQVYGEFYSLPPINTVTGLGVIEKVNIYPYMSDREPIPDGTPDPSPWLP
jgi:hypothetical protein